MRVALLLAYVRYACASVDQVEEGARAGRVVERLGGLGGWPMAVAPERGGSSCCGRGCADGCGGCRRRRGRRASPAASGRQPFCGTATSSGSLLFPPLPSPPPSPAPSHPPSDPSVSLHALVVSVALPRSSGTTSSRWRVLFSSRSLLRIPFGSSYHAPSTLPSVFRSIFDPSSFVRSHGFRGREISPSTIAHVCTLAPLPSFLSLSLSSSSDK